jgi:hypothetical protein
MADDIISAPFNRYRADPARNAVVPGQWFSWVNNGLGMMAVQTDLPFGEPPYFETNPATGQITLHVSSESVELAYGWQAYIAGNAVGLNTQSILQINQKSYYLEGYLPTPALDLVIPYVAVPWAGVERYCVWLDVILSNSGLDDHDVSSGGANGGGIKYGAEWPVYDPEAQPRRIFRPLYEFVAQEGASRPKLFQHAMGLITIDVP